jgi:hypothetical protein
VKKFSRKVTSGGANNEKIYAINVFLWEVFTLNNAAIKGLSKYYILPFFEGINF